MLLARHRFIALSTPAVGKADTFPPKGKALYGDYNSLFLFAITFHSALLTIRCNALHCFGWVGGLTHLIFRSK